MEYSHQSVLLEEVINHLEPRPKGIYLDGTLGGGGHSKAILKRLDPGGQLIGIDRDEAAIVNCFKTLGAYMDRLSLVRGNFKDTVEILRNLGIAALDGAVLDLGVSSYQLDEPQRGFSYMHDAALDMRMDTRSDITAFDVVNGYSEGALARIISEYGEERWAKRIAEFIVKARADAAIRTTYELVSVIKAAIPKAARQDGPHPAKRTFQAIRIEINNELDILESTVRDIVSVLKPGGRICIITFHSLEDRIIKDTFRKLERPCTCPDELPVCICGTVPTVKIITKRPVVPTEREMLTNPRARSAKLRVAEKL